MTEEEKVKIKDEQTIKNKCPACNASISYNPTLGKWKCEYCYSEFTLEEMQAHSGNASTKEKNEETKVATDNYDGYINYRCESCGAEIIADEQTSATFCVYCGNTAILKSKLAGKFNPSKIIPFKKTHEDAKEAFRNISKGRPLVPKDFNKEENIEKIKGVYIPFWLHDINISGDMNMVGTRVQRWSRGDTHYTKTDTYNVVRGGSMNFFNVPVDGSSRFDNDIMNSIEPFDYKEMVPYNHAFLSGFYAEKYDIEGEEIFNEASTRAMNSAKEILKADARGYTTLTSTSDTLVPTQKNREYALFPVWMVNVKYKDKMHIFAMNGQTGEFIGNIPIDKGKLVKWIIISFIIAAIIITVLSYLAYMGGMK